MGVRGIMGILKNGLTSFGVRCEFCPQQPVNASSGAASESAAPSYRYIVVDGNAFVYWLANERLGNHCAVCPDYAVLADSAVEWYQAVKNCGIICLFVFDGPTPVEKMHTKMRRAAQQCRDIQGLWEAVRRKLLNKDALELKNVPAALGFMCVMDSLRSCGANIKIAQAEADSELLAYAHKFDVIGILSEDTDMLLTSIDAHHYPLILLSTLEVIEPSGSLVFYKFHADRFVALKGLILLDIPLLSVLAGNDEIQIETLYRIHELMQSHIDKNKKFAAVKEIVAISSLEPVKSMFEDLSRPKRSASSPVAMEAAVHDAIEKSTGTTNNYLANATRTMQVSHCSFWNARARHN
jgi:hypothetical protein